MTPRRLAPVLLCLALALPAAADSPLAVRLVRAAAAPDTVTIALSGVIEAAQSVPVGFRSGGRIVEIAVDVGASVTEGQLLARLDETQARATLEAARAQLAAARAQAEQERQARDRLAGLTARGAATQAALDAATQDLLTARAARDQAEAAFDKARQGLADTRLTAPVAGIVTDRRAEAGQIVGAAQNVLTLAQDGLREAVFHAPNAATLDSLTGRDVVLRTLNGPPLQVAAVISEVAPMVTPQTGTVAVKARLRPGQTPPGLGAAIAAQVDLPQPAGVALPASALVTAKGAPAVWTVDETSLRARLSPVEIARFSETEVHLSAGVLPGALVVAVGAQLLYPDRKVAPVGAPQ
ncbi:efflux RND transporter periplasmic adaptor subunit [Phaeovulum vinaykumarii]|uniref:RND family efflux transporter, MFP subunit n=1 Tax=Phaeovulum vinaykumarii TaxID=407234 RepID=A0A1N7JWE6_9RHOB|nr:efflux RND transporter periplasmic adaptor subunit [Phaeovulum vinaykumarii]SIS53566.1 RND family efflux transporter, MFP subunit [Phaeovulum vinaykumarii]SOB91637.1 RND family efflux transporter MFP subunit [Phaeovulum vinaykumarii]